MRLCTFALLLLCSVLSLRAQTSPDTTAALAPACAALAVQNPQLEPLANTCQYALSPQSLPNFICEETVKRWARGRELGLVTEEVTFFRGHDRYSNYTINGKSVPTIENTGGWVSNALFGAQLTAIFIPESETEFAFTRETKVGSGPAREFSFHFDRSGDRAFNPAGSWPGFSGKIQIDETTGRLQRVEARAVKTDPKQRLASYRSTLDYGEVLIPDLGSLLLPVSGEEKVCLNTGVCFRNTLSFHDCRKFGSEVSIVPNAEP